MSSICQHAQQLALLIGYSTFRTVNATKFMITLAKYSDFYIFNKYFLNAYATQDPMLSDNPIIAFYFLQKSTKRGSSSLLTTKVQVEKQLWNLLFLLKLQVSLCPSAL